MLITIANDNSTGASSTGGGSSRSGTGGASNNRSFTAAADQSLLDAAADATLNLPNSCKGGNCGACKARLLRGEIHYPHGTPLGLTGADIAEGLILLCQARARTDLILETLELHAADAAGPKRLPCRIERSVPLSHDVMGLYLRLPIAADFTFEAGQYIDIILPGGRRRSFSIASPPHDARPLELHVRRVAGGEFTDRLFHEDLRAALLTIEGPLGSFTYRADSAPDNIASTHAARGKLIDAPPMLLIGGGTGVAPLLSILRHVIDNGIARDMQLFWGVRNEQDLYAHATLDELSRRAASLTYTPVLSEPTPAWRGLTGWVHDAAFAGIQDLGAIEVYAAGPPAMIAAIQREYAARGCDASRLYFDSFDYAPDTLERQR
ncbi:MAG TPA: 2Fe-2S iron-sulfur cluster-binding protein, partial [Steroidobacteraceae bacterium]|nr:2Fe-2S iron-sulfur cluster-binding protein [Steroidobacteraceae bacterium]